LDKARRSVSHPIEGVTVPGTNIKQVEAAERSTIVKAESYRIDLDLTTGAENFRVKTTVKFAGLKPGATMTPSLTAKLFIFQQLPQRTSLKLNMMEFTQTLAKVCIAL
jgi:hypothetical protein